MRSLPNKVRNVEENPRNLYTKDLELMSETKQLIFFTDNEGTVLCEIEVSKTLQGDYSLNVKDSASELIEKRTTYRELFHGSEEELDKSLQGIQYWIRKVITEGKEYSNYIYNNKREAEGVEEVVEVELAEGQKQIVEEVVQKAKTLKAQQPEKKIGLEGMIMDLVKESIESQENADYLEATIREELDRLGVVPGRKEIVIKKQDKKTEEVLGVQHKEFPKVLQAIQAGVNVALVGPAGSGKTSCVAQVAKALDLKFYAKSVSAQTGVHEFFGYQDANGNYVRTIFREAYENGGVFLLDEFDAGNPNVLAALNQATANETCAFADGMINKNADFVVVMAGNTFGHGATSEYVGRNKIDAATLDRFAFIFFDYDEDFEMQLAPNKAWCRKVQSIRKTVASKKIKTIVSPRASFDGSKLLAVGMKEREVMQLLIYKGLNKDEVSLIKSEL